MASSHSASALAGATIVTTRAAPAAAALRRGVRGLGGCPLSLPGLSLRAWPDPVRVSRQLRAALKTADAAIFSSPAAVRFAFRLTPPIRLATRTAVFALGAGTQRALARRGVRALAPRGRSDSEALLALAELAEMRGRNVALIGAPGGRDLIASVLRSRAARVEEVHVYERMPPRLTRRHFDALAQAADPLIMLLSSGAALANLVALLPPLLLARVRRQTLVVSGMRLAAVARENGFEQVVLATSALPRDLLDAACKALARHRL